MKGPTTEEVIRLARSIIRDMSKGYQEDQLSESPEVVCQLLTEVLEDEYDFETGEET